MCNESGEREGEKDEKDENQERENGVKRAREEEYVCERGAVCEVACIYALVIHSLRPLKVGGFCQLRTILPVITSCLFNRWG